MDKHFVWKKIRTLSAILAIVLSVLILIGEIIVRKGLSMDIHALALCMALLGMGIVGRKYIDSRILYLLVGGIIATVLSLTYLIGYIEIFMAVPTALGSMYILTLPVTVLFTVVVILRGNPRRRS